MKKSNLISFENQVFYIGIDVHKRSWAVTIRMDGMVLKTYSMNPDPAELARSLKRNYPGGIYKTTYEAGFCGFWIHRDLLEHGIDNIVIHAADVPTTNKEKVNKTDKVDSKKLAKELENNNLNSIYVPLADPV
jgi:transposase